MTPNLMSHSQVDFNYELKINEIRSYTNEYNLLF